MEVRTRLSQARGGVFQIQVDGKRSRVQVDPTTVVSEGLVGMAKHKVTCRGRVVDTKSELCLLSIRSVLLPVAAVSDHGSVASERLVHVSLVG